MQEQKVKTVKDELVAKLVSNLPSLRAKLGITQSDLAISIGIGRQTLLAIENLRGRMRWDTFLAAVVIFSRGEATSEYMKFLGIHLQNIEDFVHDEIMDRKGNYMSNVKKLWTDYESDYGSIRELTPLPVGIANSVCPKCGSEHLTGALITPTADEYDPNILCMDCGYWRD
jgi:DNA-binding XRE family transcriptional regulator